MVYIGQEDVVGHNVFENNANQAGKVNNAHYKRMITDYPRHEIKDIDVEDMLVKQDGEICYTSRATLDFCLKSSGDKSH